MEALSELNTFPTLKRRYLHNSKKTYFLNLNICLFELISVMACFFF